MRRLAAECLVLRNEIGNIAEAAGEADLGYGLVCESELFFGVIDTDLVEILLEALFGDILKRT